MPQSAGSFCCCFSRFAATEFVAGSCAIEYLAGLCATHPLANPGNVAELAEVCCPVPCCAGAEVQRLRPVSITHPEHPVNVARRRASEVPGAVFADQFENLANLRAHLDTGVSMRSKQLHEPDWTVAAVRVVCCSPAAWHRTAPAVLQTSCPVLTLSAPVCTAGREILQQTQGCLHAFVSGAGTGGTIAGVSQALKAHKPSIQVVLADPQGSSLFNKVGCVLGGACGALVCMHARLCRVQLFAAAQSFWHAVQLGLEQSSCLQSPSAQVCHTCGCVLSS